MNSVQIYNSVNINTKYKKINNNPDFRAFVVTKNGNNTLNKMQQALSKQPQNFLEELKLKNITECLKQIEEIKPFAEASSFFDLIFNGQNKGKYDFIIKSCDGEKILSTLDDYYIIENDNIPEQQNKIFIKMIPKAELKLIKQRTSQIFQYEAFFNLFRILEKNAQAKAKK